MTQVRYNEYKQIVILREPNKEMRPGAKKRKKKIL